MLTRRTVLGAAAATGAVMATSAVPTAAMAHGDRGRNKDILIEGGRVITMDPEIGELDPGDVLIQDGKITRIAERIHPHHGAERINASGKIVAPGYVDPHAHLGESLVAGISADADPVQHRDLVLGPLPAKYTVEGMYYGTLAGALEGIDRGITTVQNWDLLSLTLDHAKAAVDALADARVRAQHSFSTAQPLQNDPNSPPSKKDFLALVTYMDRYPLLSPHLGTRNPNNRPDEILQLVARSIALAREHGWPVSMHAGLATSVHTPALLEREGLLGDDIIFINGSAFGPTQMAICAAHGVRIISEPESEMQQGSPIPTGLMLAAGIAPTVSTGSRAHNPPDMPTQIRLMLQSAREKGVTVGDRMPTMKEGFMSGTVNSASVLKMDAMVGSLSVGKEGDLIVVDSSADLFPTMNVYSDLLQVSANRVETVIIAGRVVKRDGELVGHNLRQLRRKVRQHQEQLLAA